MTDRKYNYIDVLWYAGISLLAGFGVYNFLLLLGAEKFVAVSASIAWTLIIGTNFIFDFL